ncbi:hypothetical protein BDZ97DRAFT_1672245 [Flammula alnicola]|nr:hypothetical protein BDZ97DRAFT_1672245 [Flammula alnicola]
MRHPFHVRRASTNVNASSSNPFTSQPSPFPPLEYSPPTYLPQSVHVASGRKDPRRQAVHPNYVLARETHREHHHDFDQHAGAEPGVNPLSGTSIAEYSHFQQDCVINVVDYDSDDVTFRRFTNAGLINLLQEPGTRDSPDSESLPPRMVRWINIGGIDWSVLSIVALKYNLHSLALEDILHERGHTHSKADYYPGHLFLRVLCHTLELEEGECSPSFSLAKVPSDPPSPAAPSETPPQFTRDQATMDLEGGGLAALLDQGIKQAQSENDSENTAAGTNPPPHTDIQAPQDNAQGPKPGFGLRTLSSAALKKRLTGLSGFGGPARERKNREVEALKKGDRVAVSLEPMFIFLLHDGTVISIHPSLNLDFTSPITERLHRPDSVLRTSEDASLLVESLLDLIVDRILEVVDEYQVKINQLEHDILLHPAMRSVRSLHILSGDLIMHKRTLDPIRTMIYGLRRYDLERCRALADSMAKEVQYLHHDSKARARRRRQKKRAMLRGEMSHSVQPFVYMSRDGSFREHEGEGGYEEHGWDQESDQHGRGTKGIGRGLMQLRRVEGHFSYKSKVYLADVSDHMDYALTSLDMFAGTSENLINYAFNIASYDMNIVMNRLTLATIIFLPLTLLTGYFGMNFSPFWSVENNSDYLYGLLYLCAVLKFDGPLDSFSFWKIALPVMALLIPIFMYDDIRQVVQHLKIRRMLKELGTLLR